MKRRASTSFTLLLLLLTGCSEAPKTAEKKEPEKPPEPVTGLRAFYQMYGAARSWAQDLEPIQLNSIFLAEIKPEAGKAGAWQARFVSPESSRARNYTYSVIESAGNLHKGVFAGLEESWSGPRATAKPFLIAALKIDSDQAYRIALTKGAEYAKKNPDKPISFLLELTDRFPDPAWRVIWGESVGTSNYSIFVDATTGKYLQTMR